MIGAGQVWQVASAWVDGNAAGLENNSPRMHYVIDCRVPAFLQGLARSQTDVQGGRLSCASAKTGSLTDTLVADCIPLGWQRLNYSPGALPRRFGVVGDLPKLLDFKSIARVSG
jgi:hypothetical protein